MSPEEAVFSRVEGLPLRATEKKQVANTIMRRGAQTLADVDAVLASLGLTPEFLASVPSRDAMVRMMQSRYSQLPVKPRLSPYVGAEYETRF
tara:strand:- start:180 stop:455 length:276 start_codon:yes stop_codon:yes gene_type:complete